MPKGAFVTMFYAIYNSESRELKFTQAGHPDGLIVRASTQEIIPLSSVGILVGAFNDDDAKFEETTMQLEIGDKLILYSDAIIEIRSDEGIMITEDEFRGFLKANSNVTISELIDLIYQFGIDYNSTSKFNDDLTLVGLEITG